jgi:hypothetical protein
MAMNAPTSYGVAPAAPARFSAQGFAVFLALSLVLGTLIGGAAAVVQTYFAPLLLFPLLVGGFLGAVLIGLMRWSDVAHRPSVLCGALLAALVCTVAAHYVSYTMAQRRRPPEDDKLALARAVFADDAARLAEPRNFFDYLRREAQKGRPLTAQFTARGPLAWLSWGVDAVLILSAALALVVSALGLPYCQRCRTWYRTTRGGRLPLAAARELAGMAPLELPPRAVATRYRLVSCEAGCGPTGLELVWRVPKEGTTMATIWLEPAQRNRVQTILDAAAEEENERMKDDG